MDHLSRGLDSMAPLILVKDLALEILSARTILVEESLPLKFLLNWL